MSAVEKLWDQDNLLPYLLKIQLFSALKDHPEALEVLSEHMVSVMYEAGEQIMSIGDQTDSMYFIRSGRVQIYKHTRDGEPFLVAEISEDQNPFFGESSLLDATPRSASLIAATPCHCLRLDRSDFQAFCQKYPAWGLPIMREIALVLSRRLRKTTNELTLLYDAYISEIRSVSKQFAVAPTLATR